MKRILLALAAGALVTGPAHGLGRRPPKKKKEVAAMNTASQLVAQDASPSEWRGQFCGESGPGAAVVRTAQEWEKLWRASMGSVAPPVDFAKYFAVAVFAGSRNTGGYTIEFLPPKADAAEALIPYRVHGPAPGQFVIQAFTQPFAVKLYNKTNLKVKAAEVR